MTRITQTILTRRALLTKAGTVAVTGIATPLAAQLGALGSTEEKTMAIHQTSQPSAVAIRSLAERILGDIVQPGDPNYDQARRVWNASIDRYPALIARPRQVADVVQLVDFARVNGLPLAVRGGGHSPAGYGTVDDGVVVDFSAMKQLDIDPERRQAWARPGLTWEEYNTRSQEHGLATPGGDVGKVGVAGLTLGGGMGWLMRKHGMTIDNLLAVELVTADGRLVTATTDEHPDLFWALRGGGGNYGIATGFQFRLHPVSTVFGGAIVYPANREVLRAYADATAVAPDELTTITFVMKAPPLPFIPAEDHGSPIFMILPCYAGDPKAGPRALAPLRALADRAPIADTTGPLPYPKLFDLTRMASESRSHSVRNGYLRELTDETIEIVLDFISRSTSPFGLAGIRELGGATARVPVEATAFAHRDKAFYLTVDNAWDNDPQPERHLAWTEAFWKSIAPRTDGAYAAYMDDEGEVGVRTAYPPATNSRLATVKRRYDPDNLFHLNPNIRPA